MHVCCVCTGNTCRSPMLEALLRRDLEQAGRTDVAVSSAGVAAAPGYPASPHSVTVMQDVGLDIANHRSTPVTHLDLTAIDVYLCLSGSHAMALIQAGVPTDRIRIVNEDAGGVPDPFGGPLAAYQKCAQVLISESVRFAHQIAGKGGAAT